MHRPNRLNNPRLNPNRPRAVAVRRIHAFHTFVFAALAAMAILIVQLSTAQARDISAGFGDLAERLLPAVVNISTTQSMDMPERGQEMPQFPPGSPFEDFFKEFFERNQIPQGPQRRATSLGSGFIIDPKGYVVTNNHVIADADEISVTLHDESVYSAQVIGRDAKTDLALLKIDPGTKVLTAVGFGDSDKSRVGDWVLAIGNPFGLGGTVTTGIISARARDINAGPYDDFIQTDASINRGNSGGPMFNLDGEVIGINTAIYSPSGGSIGIGFAIPSSMARHVISDIREHGKIRRGWLGVRIQSLDKDMSESLGLTDQRGALVAEVEPGGPAAKAGIKSGDVILKFDGKDVTEMRRLPRIVAETEINRAVNVELWREGKRQNLRVTVGELNDEPPKTAKTEQPDKKPAEAAAVEIPGTGLSVMALNPSVRERFNLGDDIKGVVVAEVKDGPAAAKGIRVGDVISEAAHRPILDPKELTQALELAMSNKQKFLLLRVETQSSPRYVALTLPDPRKKK